MGKVLALGPLFIAWWMAAQAAAPDPTAGLVGQSGWVGVGLLGLILAWLFWVHLPSKDRQVDNLVARHEANTANVEKERREDFRQALQTVVNHCERESNSTREVIKHDLAENTAAVLDLRRVLEEVRDALRSVNTKGNHP